MRTNQRQGHQNGPSHHYLEEGLACGRQHHNLHLLALEAISGFLKHFFGQVNLELTDDVVLLRTENEPIFTSKKWESLFIYL